MADLIKELTAVKDYFDSIKWTYRIVEDGQQILCGYEGKNGKYRFIVAYDKTLEIVAFVFFDLANIKPDNPRFGELLRFVAETNYSLITGSLGWNPQDGEIRFSAALPSSGTGLTRTHLEATLARCFATCDYAYPNLMKFIWGQSTPPVETPEAKKTAPPLP